MTSSVALQVAQILLEIQAVSLSPETPYVWTSGLKSPIYCDNRLIMSFPKQRFFIEEQLASRIQTAFPEVQVVAGVATAGIPHASMVAQLLDLPLVYVRSDAKKHGKKNQIEGLLPENTKVVLVEDLISTGKSVLQAAKTLEEHGAEVIGCVAIFNYLLPVGKIAFEKAGYSYTSLTDYEALIQQALLKEELQPFRTLLENWHLDPEAWSQGIE